MGHYASASDSFSCPDENYSAPYNLPVSRIVSLHFDYCWKLKVVENINRKILSNRNVIKCYQLHYFDKVFITYPVTTPNHIQ